MERKSNQMTLLVLLVNAFLCLSSSNVQPGAVAAPVNPVPILGAPISGGSTIDISKLGAKPGADAAPALTTAWKQACASTTAVKIVIPAGNHSLSPVDFCGPCKAPITFEIAGNFQAPKLLKEFKGKDPTWVYFQRTKDLTIKAVSGGGIFDGNGEDAWRNPNCGKDGLCALKPYNFRFFALNDTVVDGVTSLDSKMFHVLVLGCYNITLQNMKITAPEDSRNTDGVHMGDSNGINILNSDIKTGDDCISVGDGTRNLTVKGVSCGPGHGFAIGSLGRYDKEDEVAGIYVTNCSLKETMFGIRIKSWLNSKPNAATELHFKDITMTKVGDPIFIDQAYCPSTNCDASIPSKVKISKVSFTNIKGTSANPSAIRIVCSKGFPCQDVRFENIDLKYSGPLGTTAVSECCNVKPVISGTVNPAACSLKTTEADSVKKITSNGVKSA